MSFIVDRFQFTISGNNEVKLLKCLNCTANIQLPNEITFEEKKYKLTSIKKSISKM